MEKTLLTLVAIALIGCSQAAHMFRDLEALRAQLYRRQASGTDCGRYVGDIVFVLDESGSIWYKHFEAQLQFVKDVVDTFDVGFNKTHIGIETFSDNYRDIFDLDTYADPSDIKNAVDGITQKRGGTYTNLALANMRDSMFSSDHSRNWVPHIAFVITDGESHEPDLTKQQASLAHDQGITVFAIGVGHKIVVEELKAIASQPDYVFMVDSYDNLPDILQTLTYQACRVTTVPPPPPMIIDCMATDMLDLMLSLPEHPGIIDTQYSVEFFKSLTEELEIGPVQTRAGLAPRMCGEDDGIFLDAHDTKQGLQRDLDTRKVQTTHFEDLFDYLSQEGFTVEGGARPGAKRATVIIADSMAEDYRNALDSARRLKKDTMVILVGVGDAVNESELTKLASPGNVHLVKTYEQLDAELVGKIKAALCDMLLKGQGSAPLGPEK